MSNTLVIVTEKAFKAYAVDAKAAAISVRVDELLQKRARAVQEVACRTADLSLAEMRLHLIDFTLQSLLRERLALLEAP